MPNSSEITIDDLLELPTEWALALQAACYIRQGVEPARVYTSIALAVDESLEAVIADSPALSELVKMIAEINLTTSYTIQEALYRIFAGLREAITRAERYPIIREITHLIVKLVKSGAPAWIQFFRLVAWAVEEMVTSEISQNIMKALATLVARLFPGLRNRTKATWAPVFKHVSGRLSNLYELALDMKPFTHVTQTFQEAIKHQSEVLNSLYKGPDERLDPLREVFTRPQGIPPIHRASEYEIEGVNEPEGVKFLVQDDLTERSKRYIALGAEQGIDGMYVGGDILINESLQRYSTEKPQITAEELVGVRAATKALYDWAPEAFKNPDLTSPEAIAGYLEKKYSPGMPFIGRYRKRRELFSSGWMQAIIDATRHLLKEGVMATHISQAFVKQMVVKRSKVLEKVRTIVGVNMLPYFQEQVFQIERNKRDVWRTTDTGIGLVQNESGMMPLFKRVAEHPQIIEGDFKDADSSFPRVLFEGICQLYGLGLETSDLPNKEVLMSAMRTRVENLQDGWIVNLKTGAVMQKLGGGGTGQSATSWDNSWGVKILFIMAWSDLTGRPASEFFDENTLANTGDDNIWGCSTPGINLMDLDEYFRQKWGMILTAKRSSDIFGLTYLSKRVIRLSPATVEYVESMGLVTEPIGLVTDINSMLTRRSAIPAFYSGMRDHEFYTYECQRTVGHAYLTAYNLPTYSMLAEEWMQSLSRVFGKKHDMVYQIKTYHGHVVAVEVDFGSAKWTPQMRGLARFPSYKTILEAWKAPLPQKGKDKLAKIKPINTMYSDSPSVARVIASTRDFLQSDAMVALLRMTAEPAFPGISAGSTNSLYIVEQFLTTHTVDRSADQLHSVVGDSPYQGNVDVESFRVLVSEETNARKWLGTTDSEKWLIDQASTLRMAVAFFLFFLINLAIFKMRTTSNWWYLAELFVIYTIDLQKLYGHLSTLFWLKEGRASLVISSLIDRDQYKHLKQLSLFGASFVPDVAGYLIPAREIINTLRVLEWVAVLFKVFDQTIGLGRPKPLTENPWGPIVKSWGEDLRTPGRGFVMTSPTATGKSSYFIVAVLNEIKPQAKVFLLSPTRYLRDHVDLPGDHNATLQVLKRGERINTSKRVYSCTPGHFITHHAAARVRPHDVVIIDEMHLSLPEQIAVYALCRYSHPYVLMTATPVMPLVPDSIPRRSSELPSRYHIEERSYTDLPIDRLIKRMMEGREPGMGKNDNVLFIFARAREASTLASRCALGGVPATYWDRNTKTPTKKG